MLLITKRLTNPAPPPAIQLPELVEQLRCKETDDDLLIQLDTYLDHIAQDGQDETESNEDLDSPEFLFSQIFSKVYYRRDTLRY